MYEPCTQRGLRGLATGKTFTFQHVSQELLNLDFLELNYTHLHHKFDFLQGKIPSFVHCLEIVYIRLLISPLLMNLVNCCLQL